MRLTAALLSGLLLLAAPAMAEEKESALGSLKKAAKDLPDAKKAKPPPSALPVGAARPSPAEWLACPDGWSPTGDAGRGLKGDKPELSAFSYGGTSWTLGSVPGDGGKVVFLCAAGRWLRLERSPSVVELSADRRELVIRVDKGVYARLRAQDLPGGPGPHALSPASWLHADLSESPDGLPSNPVELQLDKRTGLGGEAVERGLSSLQRAGLLPADSIFRERRLREGAADWVDHELKPDDGRVKGLVWTQESEYFTAKEEGMIRSGLELQVKRPGLSEYPRITEYTLLNRAKKKR